MRKIIANAIREEKEMRYKYWKVKEKLVLITSRRCDILTMGYMT